MASFNRVVLVGNLTRDIELRYTPGGTPVSDVAIAINDRRKSNDGQWIEEVTFVDITMWGRTAEVANEYLGKGSPILIEGRLKQETWETDGKKRSKLKVICERMQMLGAASGRPASAQSRQASARNPSDSATTPPSPQPNQPQPEVATSSGGGSGGGSDYEEPDIPF